MLVVTLLVLFALWLKYIYFLLSKLIEEFLCINGKYEFITFMQYDSVIAVQYQIFFNGTTSLKVFIHRIIY